MVKRALYEVARECYTPGTPLFGCRPVAMVHDEILIEGPAEDMPCALDRLREVMLETAARYLPGMAVKASGKTMERWTK
jgi:hypothetical protein